MIKQVRIKPHSKAWFDFRYKNGIGGSETAYVLSEHSEELADLVWKSALQKHLEDIGEPVQEFMGNVPSEAGNFMEPIILEKFRYYNLETHDEMEMYDNMRKKRRLNKIIRPNCFYVNSKLPWLFNSPDACGYLTGKGHVYNVESKNTNSMEADRYPNKISPAFILQVMQGLLITEKEIAYVIIQIDGTWTEVINVERDKEMCQKIEYYTAKYWQRVMKCRDIKKEYGIEKYYGVNFDFMSARQQEGSMILQSMEPEFQGSKAEMDFILDYIKPTEEYNEREGTQDEWDRIGDYLNTDSQLKSLGKQKNIIKAELLKSLGGYHKIFFGLPEEKMYLSYKPDVNGVCRFVPSKKLKLNV